MNFELMIETFPKLLAGSLITIQLVTISLLIGFCLAIGLALLRLSNYPFFSCTAMTLCLALFVKALDRKASFNSIENGMLK